MRPAASFGAGALAALVAACGAARPALAQGDTSAPFIVRATLLVPDSARTPAPPDSAWKPALSVMPGRQAGVRLDIALRESLAPAHSLSRLRGEIEWSRASWLPESRPGASPLAALAFIRGTQVADTVAVYAYLGYVPQADTVRLKVWFQGDSGAESRSLDVWVRSPSRFTLGASAGAAIALNDTGSRKAVRRIGMSGRLLLGQVNGVDKLPGCRIRSFWHALLVVPPLWCAVRVPARGVLLLAPGGRWLRGAFLMEGEFLLGLAGTQAADSAGAPAGDSALTPPPTFARSAEGSIRIEVPLLDLGGDLAVRAFGQGGFVTVSGRPDIWLQQYWGLRLGIDQADVSGRQSYVEVGWGFSDNLRPRRTRSRIAVQLRAPGTPIVVQIAVNYRGAARFNPSTSDNPVVAAVFAPIDLTQLFSTLTGGASGAATQGVGP